VLHRANRYLIDPGAAIANGVAAQEQANHYVQAFHPYDQ
jgi:hypothetical protein